MLVVVVGYLSDHRFGFFDLFHLKFSSIVFIEVFIEIYDFLANRDGNKDFYS